MRWRSDPSVYRYFRVPEPLTMKAHLQWYEDVYLNDFSRVDYVVIEKESRRAVGSVYISALDGTCADVGYIIGEVECQGRGYATEAVNALVDRHAKAGVGCFRAVIHPKNVSSVRVVEKCGFNSNGYLKSGFVWFEKDVWKSIKEALYES